MEFNQSSDSKKGGSLGGISKSIIEEEKIPNDNVNMSIIS